MDLSRISINARLRTTWEAVDLGFVLARAWWWPLFWSWVIPAVLVFVVLSALFPGVEWLAYGVVWWLKPLWDRGPLYIASRRLFGDEVGARQVFLNLWQIYKTDLLLWITLRRFSVTRSFDMPLTVLENLNGESRSSRLSILHRRHSSAASWLTVVCVHIEGFLVMGAFLFFAMMVPDQVDIDFLGLFVEQNSIISWLDRLLIFCSMAVVAPFYTLAGFALYISRRIDLEAWDIEIRFRHLADIARNRQAMAGRLLSAGVIVCLLALSGGQALPAQAAEPTTDYGDDVSVVQEVVAQVDISTDPYASDAKTQILTILESEAFHRVEHNSGWRLRNFSNPDEKQIPDWLISVLEFIAKIMQVLGRALSVFAPLLVYLPVLLVTLIAVVLAVIVYRNRVAIKTFMQAGSGSEPPSQPPKVMFGLDVTRESLPQDIPGSVRDLWRQGEHRAAVSLLYRALLAGLIHRHGFAFADSFTEGECVALVKSRGNAALSHYTASITQCWQLLAYGHRLPADAAVERLCTDWQEVFPSD